MSNFVNTLYSALMPLYYNLKNSSPSTSKNFAILKIAVDDSELRSEYKKRIDAHNNAMLTTLFADSGFDLLTPSKTAFTTPVETLFLNTQVKCEMVYCDVNADTITSSGFYTYPRSSISKTPLMLANHTGIIDSGYRGALIGAFRWLVNPMNNKGSIKGEDMYVVEKHARLLQICHPTLCPIYVMLVTSDDLTSSERGDGGFGSTGV